MSFKKNTRVAFTARKDSGEGKITAINETIKGPWYVVKADGTGKEYTLRAAHLKAL